MHASPLPAPVPVPWGRGQLLAFSAIDGPTALARDLIGRTMPDGLDVVMPGRLSLRFPAPPTAATFAGDWFTVETPAGAVRGVLLDHAHLLLEGGVRVEGADPALAVRAQAGRTLIGSAAGFAPERVGEDLDAALARRQAWMGRMLARLPAGLAAKPMTRKVLALMKTQVCSPEGAIPSRWTTPDRWPHQHAWLWDSAFHAVGWRHLDPALALEQLGAVLAMQGRDGFIPHRMAPDGGSDITQPPVLAWGASEVLALHADDGWLAWAYPRLGRFVDWMIAGRATSAGLLAWKTSSVETCRCDESGWDNSPRFDRSPSPMAVDLNAFLARECRVLAGFALRLGHAGEAVRWNAIAADLAARIDALLWDERQGLYGDRGSDEAAPRAMRTPAGLLPLLHGLVPPARAARLARCLADPEAFGTPMPLPSVAMADLRGLHAAGDMWRGPVWININHQVVAGLRTAGLHDEAERLRTATLAVMERWHARCGSVFEFYDPLDREAPPAMPRKGRNDPSSPYHQVIHDYGWSATCWLDLAMTGSGAR
jgi:glycogen debranching enzyme